MDFIFLKSLDDEERKKKTQNKSSGTKAGAVVFCPQVQILIAMSSKASGSKKSSLANQEG